MATKDRKKDRHLRTTNRLYYQRKYQRIYWLKRQFGLSFEQYELMLNAQNGKCAICETAFLPLEQYFSIEKLKDVKTFLPCVDHDHVTGKVRALLCDSCNVSLGRFKDSVVILQRAIDYLNKHSQ